VNESYLNEHSIEEIEFVFEGDDEVGEGDLCVDYQAIDTCSEADEQWSYVGKKSNPIWLWYAIDKQTGVILTFIFGKRTDEVGRILCERLKEFNINRIWTDGWGTYAKYLPEDQHQISKSQTWRIERKNLTLRTHIKRLQRKTICFSKSQLLHETVIGLYINKHHFQAA
jgi:insertion element IS1 protein InsB